MDEEKAFQGSHPVSGVKPASQSFTLAQPYGAGTISCLQSN
ncbi:hypothetical protein NBRC3257_0663 [Gluconobacter thailandicus NBRC 3257]|uniref:Uncharacterized protein n=1 Tax=Gluconobacter thailandicus NBRC 3257 TaxID=1381097 RepID=A0ABQ0ITX0_GLUTH|nr:hypothetical protein NBRC3257_0663 [Gluconobacter thailandicus NBRC 3257]